MDNNLLKVSTPFGIVVRLQSLIERNITRKQLLHIMETDDPLDENEDLISFGPHFGEEAATEFSNRLEALGLHSMDDYFVLNEDLPEWLFCKVAYRPPDWQ